MPLRPPSGRALLEGLRKQVADVGAARLGHELGQDRHRLAHEFRLQPRSEERRVGKECSSDVCASDLERYLRACASRLPTLAPPDLVTNWVRTGTALLTSSGFSPSFENADAAPASPAADPPSCDSAPTMPTSPPAAGAALSSVAMPGTAPDTCENSSGFRRDFASEKSAPAAPADCSRVAASSFDNAPTSSGPGFAAPDAAVADCGSPARAVAPAPDNIANRAAQAIAGRTV